MSLWNTVQKLARDLPKDFIVRICIENGSAWVELCDGFDNEVYSPDVTDNPLAQQLIDALKEAENLNEECRVCGEPYWKCDHILEGYDD
jgi:hypothetical protein